MKLDEFMVEVPPATQRSKLRPHHADIATLRDHGYTLAQVCDFLARNGVVTSPSNVASYLRRDAARAQPPQTPHEPASTAVGEPPSAISSPTNTTTAATTPLPEQFKYGVHDPRRIDEIMRRNPDLKAYAKLAKSTRQP